MLERMQRKRNPHTLLVGLQIGTDTIKNSMEVPQKTKNGSTIWSSNPSTGCLPKRHENPYLKRYLHTDVHSSIIHSGQHIEATEMFYNRWLFKEAVVHIYNGILLSHKKKWNTAICDNMDGTRDNHAKRNKPDRKSWKSHDITCMWDINLKATIEQDKQTKDICLTLTKKQVGRELGTYLSQSLTPVQLRHYNLQLTWALLYHHYNMMYLPGSSLISL